MTVQFMMRYFTDLPMTALHVGTTSNKYFDAKAKGDDLDYELYVNMRILNEMRLELAKRGESWEAGKLISQRAASREALALKELNKQRQKELDEQRRKELDEQRELNKARRRAIKARQNAEATQAPQAVQVKVEVEPQVEDKRLEEEIEAQNRELARLKREQKGLIPTLVPPPAPQVPRPAAEEPVAVVGSKAHKKRSKKGQQQAKAAARALEKAQEETRVFLKETAPGFREVDGVTGEPSQEHVERVAKEAMRAQVKGDRKKAKELQREDREERTAELFGL